MMPLLAFLFENYGVLVTTDAEGNWVCQICGKSHPFASEIEHADLCAYRVEAERYAQRGKS